MLDTSRAAASSAAVSSMGVSDVFKKKESGGDVLAQILDEIKLLREDVQRAGVISGLLSRPGGQSFEAIKEIADKFAKDEN